MLDSQAPRWTLTIFAVAALWTVAASGQALAAETVNPETMSKTWVVLKLDSDEPLSLRTTSQAQPPSILLEFPAKRVIGSLPDRSIVGTGVIRTILTNYQENADRPTQRFIRTVQIVLSASYPSHVRSEPGRVVIEIDHPASVRSTKVEVGLKGGTIIGSLGPRTVSERFRAMQEALASVTPTPWTLRINSSEERSRASPQSTQLRSSISEIRSQPRKGAGEANGKSQRFPSRNLLAIAWVMFVVMGVIGAAGIWLLFPSKTVRAFRVSSLSGRPGWRISSGMLLVDQLVWRAFERQGYQLIVEKELVQPPAGTLRIILKDGSKAALLCAGSGPFFEKQTVEQFIKTMREASVQQGFLVAAGSFTVPAQRLAKTHRVTLIGREELTELLSVGATSEYVTKELEQQRARLEEAKETLRQYASELETLRRQRNEASWYLGEERAKSAKLEADLAALNQQLRHQGVQLQAWEQEATTRRTQWEESQWYLGEAQARLRHLETQLGALQEIATRVETTQHERDEANWFFGEERAKRETLETTLAQLQEQMQASAARERELQEALQQLRSALSALQTLWAGRRSQARVQIPDAVVELEDGANEPIFAGTPRNVSSTGLGLETGRKIPRRSTIRIRLHTPRSTEPIELAVQLMWQQSEAQSRYLSGYRFVDLPATARTHLEQLVEESLRSPAG